MQSRETAKSIDGAAGLAGLGGFRALLRVFAWSAAAAMLAGCDGPQSALDPAGEGAAQLARLFWFMAAGAGLIWAAVMALAAYAARAGPDARRERQANVLIIGCGVVIPTVALAAVLVYGLMIMPTLRASAPGLRIAVSGEQWWWRVRYLPGGGAPGIDSANEIRLPAGRPTELILTSPDVIHSLWIPALAGKLDMIPGRETRLVVQPTRPGTYRGACAEYCGTAHALMAFTVVVMEEADFRAWLDRQSKAAAAPADDAARRGEELFLSYGCHACHAIRGTKAEGRLGPDLTHVGGRATLGAGTLPNTPEALKRWIAHPELVKPAARMPSFSFAKDDELEAIAHYLKGLT